MAFLTQASKPFTRARILLLALGVIIVLILSSSASSRVRSKVKDGIHKALKHDDVSKVEKAIIVGTVDTNLRKWWLEADQISANYTGFLYWMGDWPQEPYLIPRTQKGREASAYLTFIVDHYDGLPKYNYFVHDNEGQWHNDVGGHKTENNLPLLRMDALDAYGYVNLRCTHEPGCPAGLRPHDPPAKAVEEDDMLARFKSAYSYLFNTTEEDVPHLIGATCCAQFAVTRETIRRRPKADYERMLKWIDVYNDNDYDKGWLFEKVWHIIFGRENVDCPSESQCRCDLYGWCGPLNNGQTFVPVPGPRSRLAETSNVG